MQQTLRGVEQKKVDCVEVHPFLYWYYHMYVYFQVLQSTLKNMPQNVSMDLSTCPCQGTDITNVELDTWDYVIYSKIKEL